MCKICVSRVWGGRKVGVVEIWWGAIRLAEHACSSTLRSDSACHPPYGQAQPPSGCFFFFRENLFFPCPPFSSLCEILTSTRPSARRLEIPRSGERGCLDTRRWGGGGLNRKRATDRARRFLLRNDSNSFPRARGGTARGLKRSHLGIVFVFLFSWAMRYHSRKDIKRHKRRSFVSRGIIPWMSSCPRLRNGRLPDGAVFVPIPPACLSRIRDTRCVPPFVHSRYIKGVCTVFWGGGRYTRLI